MKGYRMNGILKNIGWGVPGIKGVSGVGTRGWGKGGGGDKLTKVKDVCGCLWKPPGLSTN